MNTAIRLPIVCESVAPTRPIASLSDDVSNGLLRAPRSLPPKYFYDEHGSALFDQICNVPEYYPTRTEGALLAASAAAVIASAQPQCIIEFGSGMSRKTRHLLDACEAQSCYASYVPFDVCDEVLLASGAALTNDYPWLDVQPLRGDYTAGLGNLPRRAARNLMTFLGGTIGNFSAAESRDFLAELRAIMHDGDYLLLGADRIKRPDVLHAAYNDFAGVTAAFNRNMLRVLNRELGADFNPEAFAHYACFNPGASRIEMHLIAMAAQTVRIAHLDAVLEFGEGDGILTEISRKFTRAELEAMLRDAGFAIERHFESRSPKFSLVLARPV